MSRPLMTATLALALCAGAFAQQPPAKAAAAPRSSVAPPLLDNGGTPALPVSSAAPAQREHRTRSDWYATEAQARALEQALPRGMISVRMDRDGEQGLDEAMLAVWDQYVAYDAPANVPVLVRCSDLRRAARLAERLSDAGFALVFLVGAP